MKTTRARSKSVSIPPVRAGLRNERASRGLTVAPTRTRTRLLKSAAGRPHLKRTGSRVHFAGPDRAALLAAAQELAAELNVRLKRVDLSAVISKYIGETEKNLRKVFAVAERAEAILFFDEADALFGRRSEVKDAHDRYANQEVACLLQRLEEFDGVVILATNGTTKLPPSLQRRFARVVKFSPPKPR